MEKYWTDYLQEAGRTILEIRNEQLTILNKIKQLKEEIKTAKKEFEVNEKIINDYVSKYWKPEEITEAKQRSETEL
jgi:hypothetical protein